jgi:hypothetical protein
VAEREVALSWVDDSRTGIEVSRVTFTAYTCSIDGRIDGPADDPFVLEYAVSCDEAWNTRYVFVAEAVSGRRLELLASGRGHWTDGEGDSLPELRGALDVDISATPFTNTLPIRRLDLRLGESAPSSRSARSGSGTRGSVRAPTSSSRSTPSSNGRSPSTTTGCCSSIRACSAASSEGRAAIEREAAPPPRTGSVQSSVPRLVSPEGGGRR